MRGAVLTLHLATAHPPLFPLRRHGQVSEVFQGLPYQYDEYKGEDRYAGYTNLTGDALVALFEANANDSCRHIYEVLHNYCERPTPR